MKKLLKILTASFLAVTIFFSIAGCSSSSSSSANKKVTLNALFMKQAGYSTDDVTNMTNDFMKANPNIKVNVTYVAYAELGPKIITSAKSGGYDVVLGDCIWPAQFAQSGLVLDVTDRVKKLDISDIYSGAFDAVTYKGKYYGVPWLNDVMYLYYNKKMLQEAGFSNPPKTWDEFMTQAKAIKEKGIVQYPIASSWQMDEVLVCDYVCMAGSFGGKFTDSNANPTFNDPKNVTALDFMVNMIKQGIDNPKSLEMLNDDVMNTFASGNSAFALNWTYMFNGTQDPSKSKVVGDVGITSIPGTSGVTSATVNGGMPLMITSGSKNPDQSWNYIVYLSSKDTQKKYVKSALPIWKSLYTDPDVISAAGKDVVAASQIQYQYIINRPQVPYYNDLSITMQSQLQSALLGKTSASAALQAIQTKAESLAKQ
jgi:multiple sugar transport system substrate-binding protein